MGKKKSREKLHERTGALEVLDKVVKGDELKRQLLNIDLKQQREPHPWPTVGEEFSDRRNSGYKDLEKAAHLVSQGIAMRPA